MLHSFTKTKGLGLKGLGNGFFYKIGKNLLQYTIIATTFLLVLWFLGSCHEMKLPRKGHTTLT